MDIKHTTWTAFLDELEKIGVAEKIPPSAWRRAVEAGLPELVPGITAGLGGILAAKYDRPVSAGAAMGGAIGAIPYLLKAKGG